MKKCIIILALTTAVLGFDYDGFRVKYGPSKVGADKEYFFKVPRTIKDAKAAGWKPIERPPGPMPELKMYCPVERTVCPLFAKAGFVAGLQIGLPVDDYDAYDVIDPEEKFVKWEAPAFGKEPAKDFWTSTQFYISEELYDDNEMPQMSDSSTIQNDGVWETGPDGDMLKIPNSEAELNQTIYKRQNCIPNMGTHYYYNMTPQLDCKDLFQWFALVTKGQLLGTGVHMFGKLKQGQNGTRSWFEKIPQSKESTMQTIPNGPQCLYDTIEKYGIVSIHIYFIDKPWNIKCGKGDIMKPSSPSDGPNKKKPVCGKS